MGGRMVGTDKSTVLWRHPLTFHSLPLFRHPMYAFVYSVLSLSLSLSLKHFFRILSALPPSSHSPQSVFSLSHCHLVSHPRYLHLPRQNLIYLYLFSISLQSVFFSFSMSFSVVSFSTYIYLVEALYTTYLPTYLSHFDLS